MAKINKRKAVVEAALKIIAEQGFHNAPMSQIAERAEVGIGTVYRYFKSKDELIYAIYNENLAVVSAHLLEGYDATEILKTRYLHLCRSLFDFLIENPLVYRFYEQYRNSPYGIPTQMVFLQSCNHDNEVTSYPFQAVFMEGIERAEINDLQMPLLAALTFSPIFTLVGDCLVGQLQVERDEIEQIFAACWYAVSKDKKNR